MTRPVALTIAGSDSCGGAGVQADLRTFTALGVHGATAITAVTAQDARRVDDVHVVPTDVVAGQIGAVLGSLEVRAVKTGMLATADTIQAVGGLAARGLLPRLVVDPVLVSSSGHRFIDARGIRAYVEHLLPYAQIVTPNLAEAAALLDSPVRSLPEMREAAAVLAARGPAVIVTGGHLDDGDETAIDVLSADGHTVELRAPRVDTDNTHGTGCTFAAAIAARLALGDDVHAASLAAKRYLTAALTAGLPGSPSAN